MEEKLQQLEKLKSTNKKLLNSSLALLICLIVLIVVLVILLKIKFNSNSYNTINPNDRQRLMIEQFNEPFTPYLGEEITAQQAKDLISMVKMSNLKVADHQIEGIYCEKNEEGIYIEEKFNKIKSNSKYSAEEEYDNNGYINKITITKIYK